MPTAPCRLCGEPRPVSRGTRPEGPTCQACRRRVGGIARQSAKACSSCQEVKPLDAFHRRRAGHNGRVSTCKECSNRRNLERGYIKSGKRRRRERLRAAWVENVPPAEVFERDGWECQLCGGPTHRDEKHPHPLAPVLDHIVPLSRGGEHSRLNTQCAHSACNSKKGAGLPRDARAQRIGALARQIVNTSL